MFDRIIDKIYALKVGECFEILFGNYIFRISAVAVLRSNGDSYRTIVIGFDDESFIVSTPSDSAKNITEKFLIKVNALHNRSIIDVTFLSNIEKY
jgi:uncharacterized protein (DUF1330 family)